MQLTLADQAADTTHLVLEPWSAARPAASQEAAEGRDPDALDELAAQLTMRLDQTQQIPLWDQRKSA